MKGIVIFQNGACDSEVQRTVSAAHAENNAVTLIGSHAATNATFIDARNALPAAGLAHAIDQIQSPLVVVINAAARIDSEAIARFLEQAEELTENQAMYLPLSHSNECLHLEELSVETLIPAVMRARYFPVAAIAASKRSIAALNESHAESAAEIMSELLLQTVGNFDEIVAAKESAAISDDGMTALELDDDIKARLLNAVVSHNNIEELFPRHDWVRHEEESAATCYHTLAALFYRLGDLHHANECLRLSEGLEDSPRALAIKGLIARSRGETLGAVANMISSLQQYESRKRNDTGEHYLTFAPNANALEVINTKLECGLAALNDRDNDTALLHFTEAVFNFDSFFGEFGIAL